MSWVDWNIFLPIGISFYTFQSMSYSIDVYHKKIKPEKSFIKFAFYVSFFPQLIAGPIVRAENFIPQISKPHRLTFIELELSLFYIFKGLIKKIVLADFLAIYADNAFSNSNDCTAIWTWIGIYAFSFQIYFDFSGYSDIAIGCSKLLGFKLPINFKRPYMATSITDFWRRWHISLSSWLKDYLYIHLGGNRNNKKWKTYRNLLLTMILGGLWHGAALNFILWGCLQGFLLCFERIFRFHKVINHSFSAISIVWRIVIFNIVTFSWILFRVENMTQFSTILKKMSTLSIYQQSSSKILIALTIIFFCWFIHCISEYYDIHKTFLKLPVFIKGIIYGLTVFLIIACSAEVSKPFIYFQF